MNIGYLYLVLTVILDSVGIGLLNKANGWDNLKDLVSGLFLINLALVLFSLSFETINMTVANTIFAGLTSLLVALMGYFYFEERYTLFQYFCIATVLFGVIGLIVTNVDK
jgi:small multidrug resistance pump